ncbi:unnamed protein product, partial [Darwinula stevensoni]
SEKFMVMVRTPWLVRVAACYMSALGSRRVAPIHEQLSPALWGQALSIFQEEGVLASTFLPPAVLPVEGVAAILLLEPPPRGYLDHLIRISAEDHPVGIFLLY